MFILGNCILIVDWLVVYLKRGEGEHMKNLVFKWKTEKYWYDTFCCTLYVIIITCSSCNIGFLQIFAFITAIVLRTYEGYINIDFCSKTNVATVNIPFGYPFE